ncbi:hypothetical protein Dalk_4613 [Desulfatibacillum aliphaticivorans]|uniref:Uncharacterized protein n=1 Tax=Desulfatibacillum aliphaticivorans TaxID=218208 RepID=B8FNL0_DESAL|nr:hypothetical protein Dalk_4613 [Desulfatibacillum aliphaticivorans]
MTEQEAIKKAEEINKAAEKLVCPIHKGIRPDLDLCLGVHCAWFVRARAWKTSRKDSWEASEFARCAVVDIAINTDNLCECVWNK